jgi:hypothetical protein
MNDFKVGDEVFWIETGYFEKLSCLEDIEIDSGEITKVDDYLNEFNVSNDFEEFTTCKQSLYFKSKNEAIDALIKHLEGMRE